MIKFSCSGCQKKISAKDEAAGKKAKCPGCGQVSVVPAVALPVHADAPAVPPLGREPVSLDLREERSAADASDRPTHSPSEKPDATRDNGNPTADYDSSLTDFLAPPQADDELGRLGDYRILKILGHGGMGVVFLGEDPKLNRKVAIKAMLPHLAQSRSSHERFLREARAAAALEHDHVVAIHHVGEDRGAPYIVMPFLKGEPLDDRLKRDEQLPLADVLRIGREIAEGLAAAHATGLIHRDIKPANIWLEAPQDRVKILDFGLARAAQDTGLTQTGAIIGTPAYMAPEQGRGEHVDARCDLFSLGVVLYRMCTGQPPFHGKDTVSMLMAVAMNEPPPPIKINADVPAGLSDLVMKLLEKDADQRMATAHEAAEVLRELEQSQWVTQELTGGGAKTRRQKAVAAPTTTALPPTETAPARRKSRTLILLAVALLLAFVGVFGAYQIVIIRDKDGKEVAKFKVPDGGSVEMKLGSKDPDKKTELPAPVKLPPIRPLDKLDAAKIPAAERFDGQPKELVAVIGKHAQHWGHISQIAVSADGKRLASCADGDRFIRLWDTETLAPLGAMEGDARGGNLSVAFAKDGTLVTAGRDGMLRTWNVSGAAPKLLAEVVADEVRCIAFLPDGKTLVSATHSSDTRQTISLWDLSDGKLRLKAKAAPKGQPEPTLSLAIAPDGNIVATGTQAGNIYLWDISTGEPREVGKYAHKGQVTGLAFASGKILVSGAEYSDKIQLWEVKEGKLEPREELKPPDGVKLHCDSLATLPGDNLLAILIDQGIGVWELREGGASFLCEAKFPFNTEGIRGLAFGPGRKLYTGNGMGQLMRFDLAKGAAQPLRAAVSRVQHFTMAFAPRTGLLALTWNDHKTRLSDLSGLSPQETETIEEYATDGLAFNPAGTELAMAHAYGLKIWDVSLTPRELAAVPSKFPLYAPVFSPDGSRVACRATQSWAIFRREGNRLLEVGKPAASERWIGSLSFVPDGRPLLAMSYGIDGVGEFASLWDISGPVPKEREKIAVAENVANIRVQGLAFSADGKELAICDGQSGVRLFDTIGKELRETRRLKAKDLYIVALSPDGKTAATFDTQCELALWDLDTQTKTKTWRYPGRVNRLAFDGSGRHLLTLNSNGTVYVLRLAAAPAKSAD